MRHYTDENGRLLIESDGKAYEVYARVGGGLLHCMSRSVDEDTFNLFALNIGLLKYQNEDPAQLPEPEKGEEIPENPIIVAPGCTLTRIGPFVVTPGVYNEMGEVITPPVMDDRFHANFWVPESSDWEGWMLKVMAGDAGTPNGDESSVIYKGVELIDPLTVPQPYNVLQ